MAATPSRPSNNQNTSSSKNYKIEQPEFNDNRNNSADNSDNNSVKNTSNRIENLKKSSCSNCKCTNISIMQLFHEMKQEFPKIPDHVVSQCVLDNCHNRNACIDKLSNETISLIQAYPSQIFKRDNGLKGANHNPNNNTSNINTSKSNNCFNNKSDKKENLSDMSQSPFNKQISQDSNNNVNNSHNSSHNISGNSHNNNDGSNLHQMQRPNTLNFSKEPHNSVSAFSKPVIKPRRTAPPPPPSSITSSTPKPQSSPPSSFHQQQQQQQQQNHNHYQPTPPCVDRLPPFQSITTPSPPQPIIDAIVSLNVNAPVTGRPPIRPRHTSELNFQPQQPFLQHIHPNSRSYTSVYFNLRPPSDNPQSPINITAGPLTYSSSSFDARQGHQNQLQITIGDGSGIISALRKQPRHLQVSHSVDDDRGRMDGYNYNQEPIEHLYLNDIIQKQLMQKDRLSMELKNNRKHLDSLQREIRALQSPLPPGGSIRLADEITRLQSVCQNMTQEVEEAGVYVIGETDEAFYNNIYTGQKLPIQNRPFRPPRPPPPAVRSVSQPAASGGGGSYNLSSLVSNCNNSALNSLNNSNFINNNNLLPNSHISNNNDNNNNNHNINNNNTEESWICSVCTFRNHPLLDTCEQCDMIKFNTVDSSSNNGGTGTIKITGAHFSPRIEDMRLLKSSITSPCTTPPALLTTPTLNGSFATPNLTANNTNSPNHLVNGFMLPN